MQQLYYTSCVPGRSVSGQGGFQIRACSRGLDPDRQRSLLRYVGYVLPTGFDDDVSAADAPCRLALLETEVGRVLCRSVAAGRDPTTSRTGNFFSHLVIDVPPDLDAMTASQMLTAPFWKQSDSDGATELPDWASFPASRPFADRDLSGFAAEHQALIRFLFLGLLSTPSDQRLFVVAHPEDLCMAIVVVSRMLPPGMARALTFSTYEKEPLSSPARIIGTYWRSNSLELPSTCYDGAGLAFNSLNGRSSPLPNPSEFAAFALKSMAEKREVDLERFYGECRTLTLATPEAWDLAYRLLRSAQPPGYDEFLQGIELPGLMALLCHRKDVVIQLSQWAVDKAEFREHVLPKLRSSLDLPALQTAIWQQGAAALRAGNVARARLALEDVPKLLSTERSASFRDELPKWIDGVTLSRDVRLYVLPHLLKSQAASQATLRERWLTVPADLLKDVLDLPISEQDKFQACQLSLNQSTGGPRPEAIQAVVAHEDFTRRLLQQFGTTESWSGTCQALISAQLERGLQGQADSGLLARGAQMLRNIASSSYAPTYVIKLVQDLQSLHSEKRLSTPLLDKTFLAVFQAPGFEPRAFLASGEMKYLKTVPDLDCIGRLGEAVLQSTPVGLLTEPVQVFFSWFRKHPTVKSIRPEVARQLERLNCVTSFLKSPKLDDETLAGAVSGLRSLGDQKERDACTRQVTEVATKTLVRDSADEAGDLQRMLKHLSVLYTAPQQSSQGWFGSLFRRRKPVEGGTEWVVLMKEINGLLRGVPEISRKRDLYLAVCGVGFGIQSPEIRFSKRKLPTEELELEIAYDTTEFIRTTTAALRPTEINELDKIVLQRWRNQDKGVLRWWEYALRERPQKRGWFEWFDTLQTPMAIGVIIVSLCYIGYHMFPAGESKEKSKGAAEANDANEEKTQKSTDDSPAKQISIDGQGRNPPGPPNRKLNTNSGSAVPVNEQPKRVATPGSEASSGRKEIPVQVPPGNPVPKTSGNPTVPARPGNAPAPDASKPAGTPSQPVPQPAPVTTPPKTPAKNVNPPSNGTP
jgi:hypothetical protein